MQSEQFLVWDEGHEEGDCLLRLSEIPESEDYGLPVDGLVMQILAIVGGWGSYEPRAAIKGDCSAKRRGKPRFNGKNCYRSFTYAQIDNDDFKKRESIFQWKLETFVFGRHPHGNDG